MAFCTQCGSENRDGAKFCQKCGAPLKQAAAPATQAAAEKPRPVKAQPAAKSAPAPAAKKPKKSVSRRAVIGGACAVGAAALAGGLFFATRPTTEPEAEAEADDTAENVTKTESAPAADAIVPVAYAGEIASEYGSEYFLLRGTDSAAETAEVALFDGAGTKILSVPADALPRDLSLEKCGLWEDRVALIGGGEYDVDRAAQYYAADGSLTASFASVASCEKDYVLCFEAIDGIDEGGTQTVIHSLDGEEKLRLKGFIGLNAVTNRGEPQAEIVGYGKGWYGLGLADSADSAVVLWNSGTNACYLNPWQDCYWGGEEIPELEGFVAMGGNFDQQERVVVAEETGYSKVAYTLMDENAVMTQLEVEPSPSGLSYSAGLVAGHAILTGYNGPASAYATVDLSSGAVSETDEVTNSRRPELKYALDDMLVFREEGKDGNSYVALLSLQLTELCDPIKGTIAGVTENRAWIQQDDIVSAYDATGAVTCTVDLKQGEEFSCSGRYGLVISGTTVTQAVAVYTEDGELIVDGNAPASAQNVVTAEEIEAATVDVDNSAGQA